MFINLFSYFALLNAIKEKLLRLYHFKHIFEGYLKNIIFLSAFIIITSFISSCTDSTSPNEGTVNIVGEMLNPKVAMIQNTSNKNGIQASEVDSIKVTSVRFLISEMKLHPTKTDTTNGKTLKVGPFVYAVTDTGSIVQLTTNSIPVGNYEKIKFEFHRFSSSEKSQYVTDPILKDFATDNRFTMIITGVFYKYGVANDFTFNSQATANLSLNLDPAVNVIEGGTTTISIQIDPTLFFKKDGVILDPSILKNQNDIENLIKNTIKALKKN